jgi:hypothetical protein
VSRSTSRSKIGGGQSRCSTMRRAGFAARLRWTISMEAVVSHGGVGVTIDSPGTQQPVGDSSSQRHDLDGSLKPVPDHQWKTTSTTSNCPLSSAISIPISARSIFISALDHEAALPYYCRRRSQIMQRPPSCQLAGAPPRVNPKSSPSLHPRG